MLLALIQNQTNFEDLVVCYNGLRRMLLWTCRFYGQTTRSIVVALLPKTARQLALRFHAADGSNKAMLHGTFNTCFLTIHRLKSTNKYHENERQSSNDDERIQNGAEIPYDV